MSKSKREKRRAAFKAKRGDAVATHGGAVGRHGYVTQVRWEKRRWTPFVDVTAETYSRSPAVNQAKISRPAMMRMLTGDPDGRIFMNDLYCVHFSRIPIRRDNGEVATGYQLSIRATDREARHDWRHFQRIKNELCGPEFEAVEVYPAESRLVDTSNQYYLWVLPEGEKVSFGFRQRCVMEDVEGSGAKQRPWDDDCRPSDLVTVDHSKDVDVLRKAQKDWEELQDRQHPVEVTIERLDTQEDPQREGDRGDVDSPADERRRVPGGGRGPDDAGGEPGEREEGGEGPHSAGQADEQIPRADREDRGQVREPAAQEGGQVPSVQEEDGVS